MLRNLPFMYCVRGNHDTPYHNPREIHKSVYGTLMETGKIRNIDHRHPLVFGDVVVHGFPHGTEVYPKTKHVPNSFHIALVHSYIWRRGYAHPQVTPESSTSVWQQKLRGYDAAVFGDNHKGFLCVHHHFPTILNCGAFLRRSVDEVKYQPKVGIINSDGSIVRYALNCDDDVFNAEAVERHHDEPLHHQETIDAIKQLAIKHGSTFEEEVRRALDQSKASSEVKKLVLTATGREG